MRIAVLLASNQRHDRPERIDALVARLATSLTLPHELWLVECSGERAWGSRHARLWLGGERGASFARNVALSAAKLDGRFDYYVVLSSALELDPESNQLDRLIEQLESEPRLALLAPTLANGSYPGSTRKADSAWHAVATCDDAGYVLRASAIDEVGFLDPAREHDAGAIDELAFRLYSRGWIVACSDTVTCRRASGAAHPAPSSRELASTLDAFRRAHGERWDEVFFAATRRHALESNTYALHRERWERAASGASAPVAAARPRTASHAALPSSPAAVVPVAPSAASAPAAPAARPGRPAPGAPVSEAAPATSAASAARAPASPLPRFSPRAEIPAAMPAPRAQTPDARPRFGIATDAALRVFAWPDWRDQSELALLLSDFARPLVGRKDACLCLRRDPKLDPSAAQTLANLEAAHARTLGESSPVEVLIVDDELAPAEWSELERVITVAVALPSSRSGERAALYAALGRKVVHEPEDVVAGQASSALDRVSPALPSYTKAELDRVDWNVVERIKALHPWFYPVAFGNLKVTPGVGSHIAADFLENRTRCRQTLLVDEVAQRCDLKGKSVLELACNCAYWSARYAERGATRVVGLEGREQYVRQAELYWQSNGFLPKGSYEFLRGNISDARDWQQLRERGPFDVTLCAGILYHTPNYAEILRWAAELTREVLIVDTRVSDEPEQPIEEPGELYFNAIRETRVKVVPNRAKLVATLRELGFAAEILPVGFEAQLGVDDVDNYAAGKAVTILARRVAVARPTHSLAVPGVRAH
ncbi:MAG: DUF1698 domain-containing protein [Planctomycetes bacterium]|nr:DUF1698 domain-containing protein [Planctomycetota bacterium]